MVAILEKTKHNTDFHQIVDFLEAFHIRYALTISPTIYVSHIRQFWSTARIKTMNQETKILATVDGKPQTISESSLRRHLKLNDKEGISSLLDTELFKNLSLMGYNILPNQRAIWIAQSKALSPAEDEPASLSRDDRQGEAFPTVSSLDTGQDKENIAKTSAMPHESSSRVPSLGLDEGTKIKDQDLEISGLQARVKSLKDKERRCAEPTQEDAPITGGIIDIGEELGAKKSTELGSNDTKEMVNVLSSMEAANILLSGGAAASISPANVLPAAGVPTDSGSFPTVSAIFTTASVGNRLGRLDQDLTEVYEVERRFFLYFYFIESRTMSSPNHPTSNIEDAFSSNFLDFIPASPDYVLTSPGKTYSSSSNSFVVVPIASPSLSLFHNDPYMKVLQVFYAKESPIPPPAPTTLSTIFPPSPVLLPLFNP
nr:hypothetical protein [Tanacetum cinerariifolium]